MNKPILCVFLVGTSLLAVQRNLQAQGLGGLGAGGGTSTALGGGGGAGGRGAGLRTVYLRALKDLDAAIARRPGGSVPTDLSEEIRQSLRANGYTGGD
ncbi:MAG: hypothetical protein MK364_09115 [Pirellulales bacterium]|nr:hypothetical protein [Pirellulales bacterium]